MFKDMFFSLVTIAAMSMTFLAVCAIVPLIMLIIGAD